MLTASIIWLAAILGENIIGGVFKKIGSSLLGKDIDAASFTTAEALDAVRVAFHKKYGNTFGPPNHTFLDRESNERRFLRSTFPNEKPLIPENIDPRGFDGALDASLEAIKFSLNKFEQVLTKTSSRELDRDRALQTTKNVVEKVHEGVERVQNKVDQTLEIILAQDEVHGAFRTLLEKHIPSTETLIEKGLLKEAEDLIRDRIEQTIKLLQDPGPSLKDLVDRHVVALRILLGNILAEGGNFREMRDQFAALGDLSRLDSELIFDAARLAFNARDLEAIKTLHALLPAGADVHNQFNIWIAIIEQDWESVLQALNVLEEIDGSQAQTWARALIELGIDFQEAANLLDMAWDSIKRPRARLAVAATTADLVEQIVKNEKVTPEIDRTILVKTTTNRLKTAVKDVQAPLLQAHSLFRLSLWYAFLDDHERHMDTAEA